ncbi:MAG: 50S ribosome-binding GTPase [Limnochordia bacterium]|nr:50S ribosome-binding GTPase [Limnochordia bacterium]
MSQCIILGKANVGKTLFAINFADYLGISDLEIVSTYPEGRAHVQIYRKDEAIDSLTSISPHQTRCLQAFTIRLRKGKSEKQLILLDSTGLIEGIHANPQVRAAMAQTLAAIRDAQVVLHMIDASSVGIDGSDGAIGEVDRQLCQYARLKRGYVILANKMDLHGAALGLERIKATFQGQTIIPISALKKQGFAEVRRFVAIHA